jgi:murein DD-endopeptidase MepM/ murein hydrolase activator NlpD
VHHVVQRGQTLWRIARAYGVPLDDLARANGLADPTRLEAGRLLVVPGATRALAVAPYPALPEAKNGAAAPASYSPPDSGDLLWPVEGGKVLSLYGAPRRGRSHRGLDISGQAGQPVRAAGAGRVVFSSDTRGGYGKTVILEHDERLRSLYAHNSDLLVREGEWVEQGQAIARVGRTGNASTEHCHFELRRDDAAIDPLPLLSDRSEDEP